MMEGHSVAPRRQARRARERGGRGSVPSEGMVTHTRGVPGSDGARSPASLWTGQICGCLSQGFKMKSQKKCVCVHLCSPVAGCGVEFAPVCQQFLMIAPPPDLCSPEAPPPPEPTWEEQQTSVLHLMGDNFRDTLKKKKHTLVMFYAPCK